MNTTVLSPRRRVANQLAALVAEIRSQPGWPELQLDACLLIYDVLSTLDLPPRTLREVLGSDGIAYIKSRMSSRYMPPEEGTNGR